MTDSNEGRVDYVEFSALDIEKIKTFYGQVFSWVFTDYGPDYTSFVDGRLSGGFSLAESVPAGGPLVVIYAEDLDAVQESIKKHGGRIIRQPFSFPGGRRFHFADPSGNVLAVWSQN